MDIIISGHGRMGKEVENICLKRNHNIICIIDNNDDWNKLMNIDFSSAVVIDFSEPDKAKNIFIKCFEMGIPLVTGTTGWYDDFEEVIEFCNNKDGTFFYAPNFSIGANLFFRANAQLAKLMEGVENYKVRINETHHIHKIESPSGTAISTAKGIIENNVELKGWCLDCKDGNDNIPIYSTREGEVTGKHQVVYDSEIDSITLTHEAKNRSGFTLGAVLAAEFIFGKKGIYNMDDLLG